MRAAARPLPADMSDGGAHGGHARCAERKRHAECSATVLLHLVDPGPDVNFSRFKVLNTAVRLPQYERRCSIAPDVHAQLCCFRSSHASQANRCAMGPIDDGSVNNLKVAAIDRKKISHSKP